MKTLVLFFTSLLITSMFIGCGSDSSSGDSGTVNIPGGGSVSTATKSNPGTVTTGLTLSTGCKDTGGTLPGCAK